MGAEALASSKALGRAGVPAGAAIRHGRGGLEFLQCSQVGVRSPWGGNTSVSSLPSLALPRTKGLRKAVPNLCVVTAWQRVPRTQRRVPGPVFEAQEGPGVGDLRRQALRE